jgi:sulfate transport system ATP-binding protein
LRDVSLDVNLDIDSGELVALLGPSGCGKTTLLRIIAGLETPDSGQHCRFSGEDATDKHVRERNVGFVFQHYALFRHMTVFENVAFGLRVKPRGQRPARRRSAEGARPAQAGAAGLAGRPLPAQLSGGQRQRIALARALAVEPKVLLLDEPFGALDAKVRKELRRWLRRLHDELHVTSIFVTHDQEEALEVADRVVVINQGQIEQVGTPQEVWDHPASPFVLRLSGRREPVPLDRAISVGPVARLELIPVEDAKPSDNAHRDPLIEAQISAQQFRDLGLKEGETLVVTPRKARLFEEEGAA